MSLHHLMIGALEIQFYVLRKVAVSICGELLGL